MTSNVSSTLLLWQWEYDDDFDGYLYSVIMAMGVRR